MPAAVAACVCPGLLAVRHETPRQALRFVRNAKCMRTAWGLALLLNLGVVTASALQLIQRPSGQATSIATLAFGVFIWLWFSSRPGMAVSAALARSLTAAESAQEAFSRARNVEDRMHSELDAATREIARIRHALHSQQIDEKAASQLFESKRAELRRSAQEFEDVTDAAEAAKNRLKAAYQQAQAASQRLPHVIFATWLRGTAANRVSGGLTAVALAFAGRRRESVRDEWAAQLAGAPQEGITVTPAARVRYSTGFVVAALRFRVSDMAAPLWRPVDWLLSGDSRVNGAITAAVGSLVLYIQAHDGLHTLLTEGWGWCAACGGGLYMLAKWVRRIRGIELARTESSGE